MVSPDPTTQGAETDGTPCDERCWADARCAVCGRYKQPAGRSLPLAAAGSYCDSDCDGYWKAPSAPHLWSEHDDVRHYTDPEGWAAHVASCPQCGTESNADV